MSDSQQYFVVYGYGQGSYATPVAPDADPTKLMKEYATPNNPCYLVKVVGVTKQVVSTETEFYDKEVPNRGQEVQL